MDGLHLPKIVKLRERSDICLNSAEKTTGEGMAFTSRREKPSEKRSVTAEKSTRKKRTNTNDRQRKASSKNTSSSSSSKSLRHDVKAQNTRRRFETIGLPKITTNIEENAFQGQDGAKKPRRTKSGKGDTISYVYSKSLQDENTMAFLRNSVDFERDLNMNNKTVDKRSSNVNKKPYGLPALKNNQELNEREQLLGTEDFSEESLTETESLLDAWEAIDDDVSNGTTYDSADCSTGV